MEYSNGQPVAIIYSDTKYESQTTQGPILTFNLVRGDGRIIGYSEVREHYVMSSDVMYNVKYHRITERNVMYYIILIIFSIISLI